MSEQDINLSTENAILMFSCHSRTTAGCKVCGAAIRTHRSSPPCATRSCQYAGLEPDVTPFRLALKARTGLGLVVVQSERNRALCLAHPAIKQQSPTRQTTPRCRRTHPDHEFPPRTKVEKRALAGRFDRRLFCPSSCNPSRTVLPAYLPDGQTALDTQTSSPSDLPPHDPKP